MDVPSSIFHPAWSPDGRTIAYHFAEDGLDPGGIHLMTADGEHLKRLGDLHKEGRLLAPTGLTLRHSPCSRQASNIRFGENSKS